MYDITEVNLSYEYLKKIIFEAKKNSANVAILGGWATFFYVNEKYRRAFGIDYLKSRDIDIFVPHKKEKLFYKIIKNFKFLPAEYNFRYKIIYDREQKRIIDERIAKNKPIYNLIYIFLDIFSDKKTKLIGSWAIPILNRAKIKNVSGFPVVDIKTLVKLKCVSFFDREKIDKEFKDACDIYALVFYSGEKITISHGLRAGLKKIAERDDLSDFVAKNVLRDEFKAPLVKMNINNLLHL
ncbi:MAG: hypothetical protein J7J92_01400 [Candidatus Aenigmarchaeota archaeon]|nr:hypothetical protein [Candidatus Aenigmarchaeota archaeon]